MSAPCHQFCPTDYGKTQIYWTWFKHTKKTISSLKSEIYVYIYICICGGGGNWLKKIMCSKCWERQHMQKKWKEWTIISHILCEMELITYFLCLSLLSAFEIHFLLPQKKKIMKYSSLKRQCEGEKEVWWKGATGSTITVGKKKKKTGIKWE